GIQGLGLRSVRGWEPAAARGVLRAPDGILPLSRSQAIHGPLSAPPSQHPSPITIPPVGGLVWASEAVSLVGCAGPETEPVSRVRPLAFRLRTRSSSPRTRGPKDVGNGSQTSGAEMRPATPPNRVEHTAPESAGH